MLLFAGTVAYQNHVINQQHLLIKQMMTDPACMVQR
jgi:hypothetical protein